MFNNKCGNNKSIKTNPACKTTITTTAIVGSRHNANNTVNDVAAANNNNNNNNKNSNEMSSRDGLMQTTYGHGIWYSEIIDSGNNVNNNALVHKQQYYNNTFSNNSNNNNNNKNNNEKHFPNKNVWLSSVSNDVAPKEQKQQALCPNTNNECDIIIVDIESDDDDDGDEENANDEVKRERLEHYHQQPLTCSVTSKFFINANIQFPQKHPTACNNERGVAQTNITCSANNNTQFTVNDVGVNPFDIFLNNNNIDEAKDEEDEDESFSSMETLSDNVSIWIDGEKHWVAGVDANTTCSQLIWALLNYQNGQMSDQQAAQHQYAFDVPTTQLSTKNENFITTSVINKTNSNQYEEHKLQHHRQQQQLSKEYDKNVIEFNLRMSTNEGSSNVCTGNKPNIQNIAETNNNNTPNNTRTTNTNTNTNTYTTAINTSTITTSMNQLTPINTKENYKIIQNSTLSAARKTPAIESSSTAATPIISSLATVSNMIPPQTFLPFTLPPGIATVSKLATEYVIVKQYHHCEEYLDGSTKVFDVLPPRNESNKKKECELWLRHLGPAPAVYINNTTPQLSSLISTDKDSGMGSPVGSARSAKFRRRKHKSSQWLAHANTLHPKLSRCSANERLMKIIVAQDETIQQQLSLLREKERQITKIEEEKHRKRERELGKNYLLETYLNGLDEADCEPEIQESVEIFIDEPYQRAAVAASASASGISKTNPWMAIMPPAAALAAGAVTDNIPSAIEALNTMAKQKLKEKEVKREKKKKRHKEKQTTDEEIQAKDFNMKTNKNKDKEKVDKQQQHHHHELKSLDGSEQEIEMQILWLEKIYILNKQLQKEEELAAKLHAKVRKHQLRKAQQTQREAQMEIDELDNNLALQCGDIRKVEANLMQTNEQLQKKLLLLERLSIEYLEEQDKKDTHNKQDDVTVNVEKQAVELITKDAENPLKNEANTLLTQLEKSVDTKKISFNNIKSKEEVIKLEKIIAKKNTDSDIQPMRNDELNETKQNLNIIIQNIPNNPVRFATNQRVSNVAAESTNNHGIVADNQQEEQQQLQHEHQQYQHHHHHEQEELTIVPAAAAAVAPLTVTTTAQQTTRSNEARSNDTLMSTSCMFIDKNMLSSLHVQNAKTIKKQMFHTQTATATTTAAAASDTKTSSQLLPPTQATLTASAFPKRQFQQNLQQYMPMASTFLTSRPRNLYKLLPPTNVAVVQQPFPPSPLSSSSSSSCPSHSATNTAITTSSSALPSALAKAHAIIVPHPPPPCPTSPSPSILAMNTVDISQLGTLV